MCTVQTERLMLYSHRSDKVQLEQRMTAQMIVFVVDSLSANSAKPRYLSTLSRDTPYLPDYCN